MKLVVHTQYRENYGTAEAPHWKNKGGSVYVIENLETTNPAEIAAIASTVGCLVTSENDYAIERVNFWEVVNDDEAVCEHWETPIVIEFDNGVARATETTNYNPTCAGVVKVVKTYTMLKNNQRENYTALYYMDDGKVLDQYNQEVTA